MALSFIGGIYALYVVLSGRNEVPDETYEEWLIEKSREDDRPRYDPY